MRLGYRIEPVSNGYTALKFDNRDYEKDTTTIFRHWDEVITWLSRPENVLEWCGKETE